MNIGHGVSILSPAEYDICLTPYENNNHGTTDMITTRFSLSFVIRGELGGGFGGVNILCCVLYCYTII